MFNPTAKALEEKQCLPLHCSIGAQLVEQVICAAEHKSKRSRSSRDYALFHLKQYEERGNKLN